MTPSINDIDGGR